MQIEEFGRTADGTAVHLLRLGEAPGVQVELLTRGAAVHGLHLTGGDGRRRQVALAHPDVASYESSTSYLGGVIGRYANRIAGGSFDLDGVPVRLAAHDRGHHLHGGPLGFDTRMWEAVAEPTLDPPPTPAGAGAERVTLSLLSPDGDQGFPGRLLVEVTYEVDDRHLRVWFAAVTDAPTIVNLTSHLYLNLAGPGHGTVDDHELQVAASRYTPVDSTGIPLGDHESVESTALDLQGGPVLGELLRSTDAQVSAAKGLDHNYVPDGEGWREVARLHHPPTSTTMLLRSDQPGLQVYSGNSFDGGTPARGGGVLRQGDGLALEPQRHPDTPHREPSSDWPSAVLRPGEVYRARLEWEVLAGG